MYSLIPYCQVNTWSLACCLNEIFGALLTFGGLTPCEVVKQLLAGKLPLVPEWFSNNVACTVRLGLQKFPMQRADANEILHAVSELRAKDISVKPSLEKSSAATC